MDLTTLCHHGVLSPCNRPSRLILQGKDEDHASVVLGASFVFVKIRVAKSRVNGQKDEPHATEVMAVPFTTGWPKSVDAWERTVNLAVPNALLLTTNCRTKYLNVLHSLSMVLKFKSECMPDFRAETIQLAGGFAFFVSKKIAIGCRCENGINATNNTLVFHHFPTQQPHNCSS